MNGDCDQNPRLEIQVEIKDDPKNATLTLLSPSRQKTREPEQQQSPVACPPVPPDDGQAPCLRRSSTVRSSFDIESLPTFIDPHRGLRHQRSVISSLGSVHDVYCIQETLGTGGFGIVTKVEEQDTGVEFALKSIPVDKVKDPEIFRRELNIARRLKHPHIVQLHHTFEDTEAYHLVMDICYGGDFLRRMRKSCRVGSDGTMRGGLLPDDIERYMGQMLSGVAYLHHYRLAHRDIKPENYLLEEEDEGSALKLTDFGLARSFTPGCKMLSKVGSVGYVAPEVVSSADGYDAKCDIWSLGVTSCVISIAAKPFSGHTLRDYIRSTRKGSDVLKDDRWLDHPDNIKTVIGQMLSRDPNSRPHAKALLAAHDWLRGGQMSCPPITYPSDRCCTVQ